MLNERGDTNLLILVLFIGFAIIFVLSMVFGGGTSIFGSDDEKDPVNVVQDVPLDIISVVMSLIIPIAILAVFIILIAIWQS